MVIAIRFKGTAARSIPSFKGVNAHQRKKRENGSLTVLLSLSPLFLSFKIWGFFTTTSPTFLYKFKAAAHPNIVSVVAARPKH